MSVFRIEKTNNYTVMSNYHLREREMSLKAKGLLSLMLSLPNDWDYTIEGLVTICKENISAIRATLTELKKFGYLEIVKKMPNETNTGRIEYEYMIYEKTKQECKKQDIENLYIENQDIENPLQLNTNKQNTKKENISSSEDEELKNHNVKQMLNESLTSIEENSNIPSSKDEELKNHFELIWDIYPNKKGKSKAEGYFYKWLKGRKINNTTIKLTDLQMYYAVKRYKEECESNNLEQQYIKHGDTFFNSYISDYVEKNDEQI